MAVHVGLMLKAELHERGISQRELAAMLGLSATHVSELIRGKRSLTPEVAIKIEQTLGLPSAALLAMQDRYEHDLEVIRRREATTVIPQSQMAEKPSASKEQVEAKQEYSIYNSNAKSNRMYEHS